MVCQRLLWLLGRLASFHDHEDFLWGIHVIEGAHVHATKKGQQRLQYRRREAISEEMKHEDDMIKKTSLRGMVHEMYEGSTHEGEESRCLVVEVEEKSTWLT